jgi:transcriptional regulator
LIYDGFQVGSEVNSDDLIKSLDELKLRVSFKVKQMKECLRVMEMIKSSGNRLESKVPYEKLNMKKIMEKVKSNSEVRVLI